MSSSAQSILRPYQETVNEQADKIREQEATIQRYERGLRAIRDSKLTGTDFGDWVQACVEDLLDGGEAECAECGTVVHEGPCVGEGEDAAA